jgi:hypothetical protein
MFIRLKDILISRCDFCFITALAFVRMSGEGDLAKLVLNCIPIRVRVGAQVEAEDGIGPRVDCHVVHVEVGSKYLCAIVVAEVWVCILRFRMLVKYVMLMVPSEIWEGRGEGEVILLVSRRVVVQIKMLAVSVQISIS